VATQGTRGCTAHRRWRRRYPAHRVDRCGAGASGEDPLDEGHKGRPRGRWPHQPPPAPAGVSK
jgi:hypothetical protein